MSAAPSSLPRTAALPIIAMPSNADAARMAAAIAAGVP